MLREYDERTANAPAPVVARMLGYHDDTTAQLSAEAGGTWRHYPPGDHSR